jgi:hypothetical protein
LQKNEECKAAGLLCKARALRYEAQKANPTTVDPDDTDQKKSGKTEENIYRGSTRMTRIRKAKAKSPRAESSPLINLD